MYHIGDDLSYGAELALDAMIDKYLFGTYGEPDTLVPPYVWTTKDGKRIPVEQMTIPHIENCLKRLQEDDLWYTIFIKELDRRQTVLKDIGFTV